MALSNYADPDVPRMDSPFYRTEPRKQPAYKPGDYGPPLYGEYRERYVGGEWIRPDGSRAPSGTRGLGQFNVPGQLNMALEIRPVLTWVALLSGSLAFLSRKYRGIALAALGGSAAFLVATRK